MSEVASKLAAHLYYKDNPKSKESFEKLPEADQLSCLELSQAILDIIDRMNLEVVPKIKKETREEASRLLYAKIEGTVANFFRNLTVFKRGLIPQEELCKQLYQAVTERGAK